MPASSEKYYMNMCEGPLFSKILRFAIPFYLSQLLQLLFNAADTIVVGRYAGHRAMAAVGCTSSLSHLMIALMFGLSMGTNVVVGNYYGGKEKENLSKTTHTAMMVSILFGCLMLLVGWFFSRTFLKWMSTPEDVIDLSVKYMRIYFGGMVFLSPYNFGSAVLRGLGDTKRPLYFLLFAGVINVILNIIFVTQFHMDVDGVAWATVVSEAISCVLVLNVLMKAEDSTKLCVCKLRLHGGILRKILGIGLPAAGQSSCYSLANTVIQSSVNSFGDLCMAGNAAVLSMDGIVNLGSTAFGQTAMSFCAQNYGAKNSERIFRTIKICIVLSAISCELVGVLAWYWGRSLISLFNSDMEVIGWGLRRMAIVFTTYGLCGLMDCIIWSMRGIGRSTLAAILTLGGAFVFRIFWVLVVFSRHHSFELLMTAYPISWGLIALIGGVALWRVCLRIRAQFRTDAKAE